MDQKEVDSKIGAKGRGGASGKPTKAISMDVPGEGKITKQRGTVSTRSASHDADEQKFPGGGGMASEHPYDDSTNFGGAGGGSNGEE